MVGVGERADLAERIARGEYVVDAEAVAEAILRRWRGEHSLVLVTSQPLDRPAVESDEDESATDHDVA